MIKALWLSNPSGNRTGLLGALQTAGLPVVVAKAVRELPRLLNDDPRIALLIVPLPMDEADLLELSRCLADQQSAPLEVAIATEGSLLPPAVFACFDHRHLRPWVLNSEQDDRASCDLISRALEKAETEHRLYSLRRGLITRRGFGGTTPEAEELAGRILAGADSEQSAMVVGRPGSGTARVAALLHELSPLRAGGKLVHVREGITTGEEDYSAFVFGKAGDSSAGRNAARGCCQNAAGGTLVIQSIEKTTSEFQLRLAELLNSGRLYPLGSTRSEPFDARLVATTHSDLVMMAHKGTFRQDLLEQFQASPIEIPPLDRCRADIPELTQCTAYEVWARYRPHLPFPGMEENALHLMEETDWPHDREGLFHFIERFYLIRGLDLDRPVRADDIAPELAPWLEAARIIPPNDSELRSLRLVQQIGLSLEDLVNEMRYAYFTMQKRRHDKREIANLLGRSSRWVELTRNALAAWALDGDLRTLHQLKRDGIWSRRLERLLNKPRRREAGIDDETH